MKGAATLGAMALFSGYAFSQQAYQQHPLVPLLENIYIAFGKSDALSVIESSQRTIDVVCHKKTRTKGDIVQSGMGDLASVIIIDEGIARDGKRAYEVHEYHPNQFTPQIKGPTGEPLYTLRLKEGERIEENGKAFQVAYMRAHQSIHGFSAVFGGNNLLLRVAAHINEGNLPNARRDCSSELKI